MIAGYSWSGPARPSDELSEVTEDHLCDNADTIDLVVLFGGSAAISPAVEVVVGARIEGADG